MKNFKKIGIYLILLLIISGCALTSEKASDAVKEYLSKYNQKNDAILVQLDALIEEENLSEKQSKTYKEIMEKQYEDLKYKIEEEAYDGDEATIVTKITVYDLYKAQKEAENYKMSHSEEFLNENKVYDASKFLDYKLEKMKKNTEKIEYTINFKVVKKEGKWIIEKVETEDLEKIHGIYNYENE